MKFQPWEHRSESPPRQQGTLEPGMQAAIDLLRAEAAKAKNDANAHTGELADGAWLRHVSTKIAANYLYARLIEMKGAKDAEQG